MTYEFTEWHDNQLAERRAILEMQTDFEHTEPRKSQIERELSHLVFEIGARTNEPART